MSMFTIAELRPPVVEVNITTNHEAHTHNISVFWQLDPSLNLTRDEISDRVEYAVAQVRCPSTNTSVAVSLMRSKLMVHIVHRMYCYNMRAHLTNAPICTYAS